MTSFLKIAGGFLVLTAFLWLCGLKLFLVSVKAVDIQHPSARTDAIVVLTGDDNRIQKGLDLWLDGYASTIFISGIHKDVSRDKILENIDDDDPKPATCLVLDYNATTTVENAAETKAFVEENDIRSIRLVTSHYHMPRALMEMKYALPNLEIYTHPPDERLKGKRYWPLILSEYHKGLWRKITLVMGGA